MWVKFGAGVRVVLTKSLKVPMPQPTQVSTAALTALGWTYSSQKIYFWNKIEEEDWQAGSFFPETKISWKTSLQILFLPTPLCCHEAREKLPSVLCVQMLLPCCPATGLVQPCSFSPSLLCGWKVRQTCSEKICLVSCLTSPVGFQIQSSREEQRLLLNWWAAVQLHLKNTDLLRLSHPPWFKPVFFSLLPLRYWNWNVGLQLNCSSWFQLKSLLFSCF